MKKILTNLVEYLGLTVVFTIGVTIAIVLAVSFIQPQIQKVVNFGGAGIDNHFPGVTMSATSTGSFCATCPVKVLSADTGRRYARIENSGNTGNTVYLYFSETPLALNLTAITGGETAATGTITTLNGLIILAPSSTYEILPEKLFTGEVWATTTNANLAKINFVYR